MKNSINYIALALLLACNVTIRAAAQSTLQDFTLNHQVSEQDSARLLHYLIGCGALEGKGEFAENRKVYLDSALSIANWSSELWFQKGFPLIFSGKYEIGMPCLDSAVKYNAKNYTGYRGYMKCIFQKHYRESIVDLRNGQLLRGEGHVEDHSYEFYIGLCYLQLNKFDSGAILFTNLINKVKTEHGWQMVHYLDWFYLGIALFEKDDFPKAIDCFDSCLKGYPHFSDAKFYKSWCLKKQQQLKPALDLIIDAKNDFKDGYTINDDNAKYESYPYQVNKYYIDESLEILDKKYKQSLNK